MTEEQEATIRRWWETDPDFAEWLIASDHEQYRRECAEYEQWKDSQ